MKSVRLIIKRRVGTRVFTKTLEADDIHLTLELDVNSMTASEPISCPEGSTFQVLSLRTLPDFRRGRVIELSPEPGVMPVMVGPFREVFEDGATSAATRVIMDTSRGLLGPNIRLTPDCTAIKVLPPSMGEMAGACAQDAEDRSRRPQG